MISNEHAAGYYNMSQNLDLGRLDDVLSHKLHSRGCGKTYARIVQAVGLLGVTNNPALMLMTNMRDFGYLRKIVEKVCADMNIKIINISNCRYTIELEFGVMRFIVPNDRNLRGLADMNIIRVGHND